MKKRYFKLVVIASLTAFVIGGCGKTAVDTGKVMETEKTAEQQEVSDNKESEIGIDEDNAEESKDEVKDTVSDDSENTDTETSDTEASENTAPIEDGSYLADFDTDNSMFHVNEAWDGKGILTVENGKMAIHIVMPSKNIVNLYYGLAEDAKKDGAILIEPTEEDVTYEDCTTETVYAFDVPVPYLDEEFDVALIGTKDVWYDHKVSVSDPKPWGDTEDFDDETDEELSEDFQTVEVTLTGGSGRASVTSPTKIRIEGDTIIATVEWSSPYYDYMIVDGQKYEPVNTEGNSVFEIPIEGFDQDIAVTADTTAMSKPHEIDYILKFTQ